MRQLKQTLNTTECSKNGNYYCFLLHLSNLLTLVLFQLHKITRNLLTYFTQITGFRPLIMRGSVVVE